MHDHHHDLPVDYSNNITVDSLTTAESVAIAATREAARRLGAQVIRVDDISPHVILEGNEASERSYIEISITPSTISAAVTDLLRLVLSTTFEVWTDDGRITIRVGVNPGS